MAYIGEAERIASSGSTAREPTCQAENATGSPAVTQLASALATWAESSEPR